MKRGYKYRIYPTEEQMVLINKTVGCARLMYNLLLDDYKQQLNNRTEDNKPKVRLVTYFKPEYPFLNEVDSLALMNARTHFSDALTNYFKSKRGEHTGKKMRFPKPHKKHKCKWSYTTNNQNGTVRVDYDKQLIKLPKLGWVKIKTHRQFNGEITSCTVVVTRSNEYYVSLLIDTIEKHNVKKRNIDNMRVVGLDVSMSKFVVSSDTDDNGITKTKYVRQYRKAEKRRRRLNRALSRKVLGSNNRNKARIRLAACDKHIANRRLDFCHKLSRHYASTYDVIMLEDINMQELTRALYLGKSVYDLGIGLFKNFLSYKCKEEGSVVIYVDKWFASSKTCSCCGNVNHGLRLSDRKWICSECSTEHDRDYNASCNLRDFFYKNILNTGGTLGINACGDTASTLMETLMQVVSLKQEPPSFRWG